METREIYFAAGCFWGTERLFQSISGVLDTECGFINGKAGLSSPSYQQVCQGDTDCREAVWIRYDPAAVSLPQLLKAFFHVVDPTVFNRQGNDVGTQYQTGIYFSDAASAQIVRDYVQKEQEKYPVFAVEIGEMVQFFPAEEYHQNYLMKNPGGYCHINPREFQTIDALIRESR